MNVTFNDTDSSLGGGNFSLVCERMRISLERLSEMRSSPLLQESDGEVGFIFPVFVMGASVFLLLVGGKFFRVSAGLAVLILSFGLSFLLIDSNAGEGVSCETKIVFSSVLSVIVSLLSGLFLKVALFLSGTILMVSLVHLLFVSFPAINVSPRLAGKSVYYWGGILLSFLLGGAAVKFYSKSLTVVITSVLGGGGIAYSLNKILSSSSVSVESWILLLSGGGSAAFGLFFQIYVLERVRCGSCSNDRRGVQAGERRRSRRDEV